MREQLDETLDPEGLSEVAQAELDTAPQRIRPDFHVRDDAAFEVLEQRVIPEIVERTRPDDQIRVWIPGCATGQEAYSIAILLHEQLAARRRPVNLKILATDVHKASLEVASAGIYAEEQVSGISSQRLERFFTLRPNGYQISQNLRESIVFAPRNLIRDSPFTKLDLITCRNLLIYFQPHAQKTILTLFHFALKTGGFMFLGSSESPGGLLDEFETVDERAKVYRKRRDIGLPADLKLPLPRAGAAAPVTTPRHRPAVSPQLLAIYDRLLERYMPPSFLVDEHGHLVDSYGGAESLLRVKGRRPTQSLIEMVGDDLRTMVSGALYRVRKDARAVTYEAAPIVGLTGRHALTAEPISDGPGARTHVLISLIDADAPVGSAQGQRTIAPTAVDPAPPARDRGVESTEQLKAIQDELSYAKENLQAAIQDLETANEELQATNEEMTASNEELQSTNKELHSVNEELSALVESSGDAIVSKTVDGILTSWNKGATRLYGYTAKEAIGRHVSFLAPPGRKEEVDGILRDIREGRPVGRLETLRVRKDGAVVDVSVTFSPILDRSGAIIGISAIARDITQLVRARNDVLEREERIRLLLDSTAESIYGVDVSGACVFCNAACARVLGFDSPAALIGRQMHALIHHTRKDGSAYPPEMSPIYEAMRHRGQAHVDDEVVWKADGTSFPAEYWSHPIIRNDTVIGAVVTFLDITERRRAADEIQEGVRRREQFLAMLSHELRNPLAAILSATRLLKSSRWTGPSCDEAGQVVERQANHMTRLLDDLLDVSRITRGRIALRNEVVDVRDTARMALESLAPLLAEHGTNLEVDITDEPLPIFGDAARLQQIQSNLLSNASRYSPEGGQVRFEVRRSGAEAVIRVSDNGRGIEPDLLPRIFDLFVQGTQSIARSQGGLGIGLTLLRTLVELHGGRVEASSAGAGRGSVFAVWLPLARAKAVGTAVARQTPSPAARTIVLVEDQADARRMMQLLLETEGRQVYTAENGLDGAQLIERLRPDLAIVDLGLPVMSGYELARRIRRNPSLRGTRLVALSGYGQDADVQAALEAGFDQHLTKPPDPDHLEDVLAGRGR